MSKVLSILYAAFFFSTSMVMVLGAALVCTFTKSCDRNRRLVHLYSCYWACLYILANPFWKLTVEGREHLDQKGTYVLVANHQSYVDIIVLYQLYFPYKWVSKESIFKVPAIGWNMRLNEYVSLARGNLTSIKEVMNICRNWLKRGSSIMMFPEGTRSLDGELQAFRDGAFRLAVDCDVPVVPIVIDGTHDILPKGGKSIRFKAHARVKVLPPVRPEDFDNSTPKLRDHVHALMKETLADMRSQRAAARLREPAVTPR